MNPLISIVGRVMLCTIFVMSAVGNKIPNYGNVAKYMQSEGVPAPQILLAGAIAFLIVGGLLVAVGFQARFGALLLAIFLVAATYYFHDFWTVEDPQKRQMEMIGFMKNLALLGAMVFVMANGSGAGSLDGLAKKPHVEG